MLSDYSNIVLEDFFDIHAVDKDGKKFDRVSRVLGKSENYGLNLILDVNSELYPLKVDDKVTLLLTRSLSMDSTSAEGLGRALRENEGHYEAARDLSRTLAKDYEYVMYGKVYKFDENKQNGLV